MKKIVIATGILLNLCCYHAQDTIQSRNLQKDLALISSDSITQVKTPFFKKEWVKKSVAPAILFTAAAATWGEKENLREVRNRYLPTFKAKYDDYLQYAPAAAVYGLKLAGVKGRNNLGRATLSYVTSLAIMGILVNSIKYTAKVERPDGSKNNSFPSGHAAMAFTNASFLHKEYGMVNPAYSIAGYGSAALTGLGRNLNNRHWIPDVLAGAGIGIISTELGYFFIDKIYKNKGDNLSMLSRIQGNDYPSFLAIKLGSAFGTTNFLKESDLDNNKQIGFEGGLEGAYFFSKKWGIGGDISFSSFPIKPLRETLDDGKDFGDYSIITQSLGFLGAGIGPYYSHEFSDKWQLTLKATGGYSATSSGKVFIKSNDIDTPTHELQIARYKPKPAFRWSTGASLTYKFNPGLGITLYSDYNQIKSTIRYYFSDTLEDSEQLNQELNNLLTKERINYFTLGLRLTAYF
ncbi:PAP2 family protein [Chryseobacterium lactis]|uniref:PAP2 family protein n=1 Tax=Chryseobacterium lactis TaxID=1241981 RepID=A0A3G6RPT6_CHRLC|nr:phosphatase PAP2 family protein [Chryseobacterium lactis]AZA81973.1 phosphatase PAP2 family protein [Chryseobacterium lactis]AZB06971.1 phosphatase PAP2 family protein [Chryseobacterium lactis]PNW11082.1 PAP2 family protein [Chryseobacterium lactis]